MEDAKYLDLMAKYLSGNISTGERSALLQWADANEANRQFFDEMIQLWSMSAEAEEPFEADVEQAWSSLEEKLPLEEAPVSPEESVPKVVKLKRRKWDWRIAAAIAVLLVGGWWLLPQVFDASEQVLAAELQEAPLVLPDGSKVWLNEDSRVVYQRSFKKRNIQLEGEAFFDIARDEARPFVVEAGSARTTVLGTSFNLRAYPEEDRVELVVESGKVRFESLKKKKDEASATLEKGQAAFVSKDTDEIVVDNRISENTTAWMRDTLVFTQESLDKVIGDLQRYFRIDIQVEDNGAYNCNFNATFPQPQLENIFDEMQAVLEGVEIRKEGERYILRGKCEPK
jgi:ferric-dicitrate binding protein FerR (iron transport regulator)